jgi:hypothetical protein
MSEFSNSFLQKIKLHTSPTSSEIAFNNLKKINSNLDDNNIITMAILASNQTLPNEEREIFKKCLEYKLNDNYLKGQEAIDKLEKN